jgi:putative glutamine amidotransferase
MASSSTPFRASKRPPAIGITCSQFQSKQARGSLRFGQNQSYIHSLARAGAAPLLLPHLIDKTLLLTLYERLDGLLLSGGEDIDPAHYGEPLHPKCGLITPDRDEMELTLTRWAVDDGMPLLAICRGIQVLNVALGGSLYQDIRAQVPRAVEHTWYPDHPRDRLSHTVTVTSRTLLARLMGTTSMAVNSMHHQAIKDPAPRLIVTACAPDQIVEAVEVKDHPFAIGVQWHPEELVPDDALAERLFEALVEACQR